MSRSRAALVLMTVFSVLAGPAGCIDRTNGGGPYSAALARLRQLGVPSRFDDALLVSLSSLACDMPAGTRASEFEPGAFRQIAAAGGEIDAGAGALVLLLYSNGASLCLQPSPSEAPTSSATSSTSTYADTERDVESIRATLLDGDWLAFTGLANPRLSVPSKGIMRIDGEAPAGTAAAQAACNVVFILAVDYSFLLTPLERAVLTTDPDPVVQVAIGGGDPILDSSPNGLSDLTQQCFGSG